MSDQRQREADGAGRAQRVNELPETGTEFESTAYDAETEPAQPGPEGGKRREASLWGDAWRDLKRNPIFIVSSFLILLLIVMAIFPGLFTSFYPGNPDPSACSLSNSLVRPNATNWFGFDLQGCDYYAKTIYGARVSMIIGITVTTFAVAIAITLGTMAGYYGGGIDSIIARITDVWFAIPFILGGIVVINTLKGAELNREDANLFIRTLNNLFGGLDSFTNVNGIGVVMFVLIVLGWPTMLRLARSSVLSVREADYVDAARTLGANDFRIMTKHILPNALAPVIVYATITIGVVIAAEAALSFLGVGLELPANSWGLMINGAQNRILSAPHLLAFPAIFLSIAVFSFILMGDALRDALDPKLR